MKSNIEHLETSKQNLPIKINKNLLSEIFTNAKKENSPILSVVIGTKPDFYKQAPLVVEAKEEKLPVFVIDTGQHFDDILCFGIKEFKLEESVGCDLQIRGDLMEKASELIIKFGSFGRYCKDKFSSTSKL
ncbi:MAG: hypothetical protein R3321_05095, partial [Nitrososphaeraceae archaeon]|nr:hypothetical protein [Nitrososphaeraceae archaeon]